MTKLEQKVSSPITKKFKENKNMTTAVCHNNELANSEINNSIMRGEILRYSLLSEEVKNNLIKLKQVNPKYLSLIVQIIKVSITELPAIDINMHGATLDILLSQLNDASFNNHEALDFTQEVLNSADILTSKYYLAHLAGGILQNKDIKKQFKASTPFIKYVLASLNGSVNLEKQINFMNAIKILVNEKADYKKIELLPRIKYIIDNIGDKDVNRPIDITRLIYSKTSAKKVEQKLETIANDIKYFEKQGNTIDCVDYLTKNSL